MPPRISIVTPSLNQGAFLEAALDSVHSQGYPDLEHIVIDGGSTDGTRSILDRHSSDLAYVQSRPDGGQTDALIQGFSRATGEILAWLNADDLYEPGALARVAEHFTSRPAERFVFGDSTWVDRDGRLLQRKREIPFNWFVWLRTYNYIPQPSAFWRRELYVEVGGLDGTFDLAMDTDLFARFAERTRPVHVPELWSRMRSHPEQKNVRLRAQSNREDDVIRRRYASTGGIRWRFERALAKVIRVAWRASIGAYWR